MKLSLNRDLWEQIDLRVIPPREQGSLGFYLPVQSLPAGNDFLSTHWVPPACPSNRPRGYLEVASCWCWQRAEWWVRALVALCIVCWGQASSNDSHLGGRVRRWPLCLICSEQRGHDMSWESRESSRGDKCRAHVKHPLETCQLCEGIKERLDRKIVLMNLCAGQWCRRRHRE